MKYLLLAFLFAAVMYAGSVADCRAWEHHGKTAEAHACWQELSESSDALLRAEGLAGLRDFQAANNAFRAAEAAQPQSAVVKTEWGKLFFSRSQPGDAAKLYSEAVELDPHYAPAYLEWARASAETYDEAAVQLSRKALDNDPKLFGAHELLAYLALEDADFKTATAEAQAALRQSPEALDAMAVLASIDWLAGESHSQWMQRILKVNPTYGEAYATGAHFLVINRRYEEAIALYRQALALSPGLDAARSQLGLNLMRVGQTEEAGKELRICFDAHFRDAQTVNALRLLDTASQYTTVKLHDAELVLNKKEASLLEPYFSEQLERAVQVYQHKYGVTSPGPVRVEVFPNHDDFVVRTLGLPGQGGLLGVTFGTVVAMDSPSARAPGEFSWTETLWHELSHVYVLTATHHLTPRWFTEGVAVHEERAASPAGSDRVSPPVLAAIKQGKLLPVLQLERGFVRPEYEGQVLVSYFEAGRMCDYIVERWGNSAVLGMMRSYGDRKSTADAITVNLHITPEQFDKDFLAWLPQHVPSNAAEPPNWQALKQHAGSDIEALHQLTYTYLEDAEVHQRLGGALLSANRPTDAVREFRAVVALHPDDLAQAHYDLARALDAAHDAAAARDQVLLALEQAPNYKPAQQLLLKLSQ